MAAVVSEEVVRCETLIDSLLALARSEAGVVERDERVDLAELARRVRARLEETAEARRVALTVRAAPALVRGERRLLEQLVWNLVQNAVLHNNSGGFAEVEVASADQEVLLRVENTGPVVPSRTAASLLEPFQRLGRGASGGPGAGVGLSIVRAVASAHGGVVRVRARPGGGLVAEVRLPAAARTEADPACVLGTSGTRRTAPAAPRRRRRGPRPGAAPR
jgi:signal transduction histidine kinase